MEESSDPDAQLKTTFALGSVGAGSDGSGATVEILAEITEVEYERYQQALQPIFRLSDRATFELVERNYDQLLSVSSYFDELFDSPRHLGRVAARDAGMGVTTALINWLTVSRLFLDHEKTRLKRQYGRKSDAYLSFEAAVDRAEKESVAFRFLHWLRNYAIHCGLPLNQINLRLPNEEERRQGVKQRIEFLLVRDQLLSDFNWGDFKVDLLTMPEVFPIIPLVTEAMPHLRKIMEAVVKADVLAALPSVRILRQALDRIDLGAADPALLRINHHHDSRLNLTPTPIPHAALRQLEAVDPEGDVLAPLRGNSDRPERPPQTPESLYRMRRGVAVFGGWLEEGGGGRGFDERLNALIAEDRGNIEPVLAGILNVGAIILHMAATALNTSPHSILAGLVRDSEGDAAIDHSS